MSVYYAIFIFTSVLRIYRHSVVVRRHGNISRIAHIRLCEIVKKKYAKSVYRVSNTDGSGRGYLEARHLKRT